MRLDTVLADLLPSIAPRPGKVVAIGLNSMDHGDVVEVESDGIGTLRNPVVELGHG